MESVNYIISGKNIDVTDALKDRIASKLGKLNKFFYPETEIHATLSVQKNRQIIEVTIPFNGVVLRAEESNDDMYTSIDKVVDVLERQIRKNKTKLIKKLHENAFAADDDEVIKDIEEERDYKVVKTKKFAIKPMTVEEAILQMNLLGHEFFMFLNWDTNKTNVVYRRKDGDYGLIEPEF